MNRLISALLVAVVAVLPVNAAKRDYPFTKGPVKMVVSVDEGKAACFSLYYNNVCLVENSAMGFTDGSGKSIFEGSKELLEKVKYDKGSGNWIPLWGKRTITPIDYVEVVIPFQLSGGGLFNIRFRVYPDGAAFRFEYPEGTSLEAVESTEFNFSDDFTAWFYNGERHNIGPEKLSQSDGERLPVMTVQAAPDIYFALHEADLEFGWPLKLTTKSGSQLFSVTPEKFTMEAGYHSAWRTFIVGNTPGALVDSDLIELLNPDPQEGMDFSWVTPGVALWDWRIDGAQWEGYTYGMNYDSWVRMIDFAAEQGFTYLVLDANWYGPEFEKSSDPTKGSKAQDVQKIIKYGLEKHVGVWLYLNDVAGSNYPIEETLAQYEKWGAAGVKYGFMNGNAMEKNQKTRNITELCAKHHLLVDFHDYPVHPYGQSRTWPNAITREYCQAQLDGRQVFQPKTFVTSVFVNMVAGPVDMNNGFFDLRQGRTTRKDNNQEVPSTVSAEAARTLITYSGATIIPDIPEFYKKYPSLLRFMQAEQMPWSESKTLAGEIGEYIVMMREASDGRILIAAATNEEARTLEIPLAFLDSGPIRWQAEITHDAPDTHYKTNRETFVTRTEKVRDKNVLKVDLAPGGGACILLTRIR